MSEVIVPIDQTGAGTVNLAAAGAAAPAPKKRIVSLYAAILGTMELQFRSGSNNLSGPIRIVGGTGVVFEIKRGEHALHANNQEALDLVITEVAAGSVKGWAVVDDLREHQG